MPTTITPKAEILKEVMSLLASHRRLFNQERVYQRAVKLALSELMCLGRHTITQLAWSLGDNESDISAFYRLLSQERFEAAASAKVMLGETLQHVEPEELYVVAGDGTQTPRTGRHIPGTSWLHNPRTPAFKVGIHRAQRWFNGCWLTPAAEGYSRAIPLCWLPAFPEKAASEKHPPHKEWEAASEFLDWLRAGLEAQDRPQQSVLMVADGNYDHLGLWQNLPPKTILLARSAKNRALYEPLPPDAHRNRRYGPRSDTPQQVWQQAGRWHETTLTIRGRQRTLQYRVRGPVFRYKAPHTPLFLIVVRGQHYRKHGRRKYREPVPYLVNALQDEQGNYHLPLNPETLIFWAWQRWEIEVCHRELKSNLGLGDKQCWNTQAAVASVQWSAWVYALFVLAGYRTWGLTQGPSVPSRWWRGTGRWSFNTLWRTLRAELWKTPLFYPHRPPSTHDPWGNDDHLSFLPPFLQAATPL